MSDRLKIAIVHASDVGSGAERCVISLHKCLLNKSHKSTLYVGEKNTNIQDVVQIPYQRGIPGSRRLARWVERSTGRQDIYNPSFRNLKNLIPSDTDVVHFNSLWGTNGYADLAALPDITRNIPGVITEHQNWLLTGHCACFHDCERWKSGCGNCPDMTIPPAIPKDGTRKNWKRKRNIIQKSDIVLVTVSDWLRKKAEECPIWSNRKILRIYNGIDLNTFHPVSEEVRMGLRKSQGIPENKIAILLTGQTLGGFREGGGIAMQGYDAINRLIATYQIVPVLIGKLSKEAQSLINGPSVALPFQETPEDMARCYQAVDITLVTSVVEAFGRVAAESQACDTPVVSFNTGGLAEVVLNEVGGLSVEKGDTEGLVAALQRMIENENLRRRLGEQGVRYVVENFEEGLIADQYINLFRERAENRHKEKG
jgi:glycosyltransferase involved in cell wall biosynthesis